ncbi:hypothetical protein PENSPDRAFT_650828 [Peniophora sp. CONT]|nr:hypothetical protein PENSPDRAFT_650828 [Peniophora sp. CONT]
MPQKLLSAPDPEPILPPPTHENVLLYHQVWRALWDGAPKRAALPPEIVSCIAIFAGWILPDRTHRMIQTSKRVFVKCRTSDESAKVSRRWFTTEPLSEHDIADIVAFQLVTGSKDQGWTTLVPPESFSWFEVAVEREGKPVSQLQWKSHHNELCGKAMSRVEGAIILAPRAHLQVRDVIVVWLYAQSYAWSNEAEKGALLFYKWFQPVVPLRIGQE